MRHLLILIFLLMNASNAFCQQVVVVDSSGHASVRGLSVVNNKIIWASGSDGMVGVSLDGGEKWEWKQVQGFERVDFRDIEAFDGKTAVIMGVGSPAYILRTKDRGNTWKVVYENKDSSMFLNAMEFWNDRSGIVIGDPVNGRFFIGRTFNGGESWQDIPEENKPEALKGEVCFAASGTNVRKLTLKEAVFVSGGSRSNLFHRDRKIGLPMEKGASKGANSLAIKYPRTMVVVGGDFTQPDNTMGNCVVSHDGGYTWEIPSVSPSGYRSCVEYLSKNNWIACGLNGVDFSEDDGETWRNISTMPFHVVRKSKKGDAVFLAGPDGKIARLKSR